MAERDAAVTPQRQALLEEMGTGLRLFIARALVFNHHVAEHLGLNATDHQCLNLLEMHGTLTASRLAHRIGLSRSATTAALDRLERAGFVRRAHDTADRRQVIVRVDHERLRQLTAPLYASRSAQMQRVWQRFTDDELTVVAAFVHALTEEATEVDMDVL